MAHTNKVLSLAYRLDNKYVLAIVPDESDDSSECTIYLMIYKYQELKAAQEYKNLGSDYTDIVLHGITNGCVVQHFKRTMVGYDANDMTYLYRVISVDALDTETKNQVVVYQALYDDKQVYVRPFDMFFSEVDKEKYPTAEQQYRFEVV